MTFLATIAANAAGVSYSPFDALGRGAETAKPCKRPPNVFRLMKGEARAPDAKQGFDSKRDST